MNISRLILWSCMLIGLCAVWGWQTAYVLPVDVTTEDDEWPHSQLHQNPLNPNIHNILMTSIRQANILPIPTNHSLSGDERPFLSELSEPKNDDTLPQLPEIVSASIINDRPRLHVNDPDNGILHMQEGDILPSGWALEAVSLKEAVFKYEDKTRLFSITVSDIMDGMNSSMPSNRDNE